MSVRFYDEALFNKIKKCNLNSEEDGDLLILDNLKNEKVSKFLNLSYSFLGVTVLPFI